MAACSKALAALGGLAVMICASYGLAADLTVTVEGLPSDKGKVSLGLYQKGDGFPDGKASYEVDVPAAQGHIAYVFKNLPPGRYALTGFHDENNNGKMDYSFIGIPKEGFVFSNDAKPGLSSPSFDACAIDVADKPIAITVHIQHWGSSH